MGVYAAKIGEETIKSYIYFPIFYLSARTEEHWYYRSLYFDEFNRQ